MSAHCLQLYGFQESQASTLLIQEEMEGGVIRVPIEGIDATRMLQSLCSVNDLTVRVCAKARPG